jgi:hypothetical protein
MSINFTSVTVTNGSANVVINTSIDLTAIQYGWELQVVGAPLMLSIASGGQNVITLQEPYTATGTLTNVAAKIIETKAALSEALDNLTLFGNQMVNTKNANQAIIDGLGTAAPATLTTSKTDTTSGRVLRVGDFGIGGSAISFNDWNAIPQYVNGMVTVTSDAINRPEGIEIGFYHIVKFGDGNESFIAKKVNSDEVYILSRYNSGTTWIVHGLVSHSGNLVNPLDYGLGGFSPVVTIDVDTVRNGHHSISCSIACANIPIAENGMLTVYPWSTSSNAVQKWKGATSNREFKRYRSSSTWGGWVETFHSGNTNFNVFTVDNADSLKMNSIAISGVAVDVELPISSLVKPSNLVTVGSFKIVDNITGATLNSGLQPSPGPTSSVKTAVARFSVTGATVGRNYRAIAESNSSITVTY